jgi:hypothetical protein
MVARVDEPKLAANRDGRVDFTQMTIELKPEYTSEVKRR